MRTHDGRPKRPAFQHVIIQPDTDSTAPTQRSANPKLGTPVKPVWDTQKLLHRLRPRWKGITPLCTICPVSTTVSSTPPPRAGVGSFSIAASGTPGPLFRQDNRHVSNHLVYSKLAVNRNAIESEKYPMPPLAIHLAGRGRLLGKLQGQLEEEGNKASFSTSLESAPINFFFYACR